AGEPVMNTTDLLIAINDANDAVVDSIITFGAHITLTETLVPIAANITFEGGDYTISGDDRFQIFFVDSGEVVINQLTFVDGRSQGGNGGLGRAGGGLGAGGALFVNETAGVTLTNVMFRDNTARGGSGGADTGGLPGGGGGGFHGDGGDYGGGGGWNGDAGSNGGGGGGLFGNGEGTEGVGIPGGNGGGKEIDGDGGMGDTDPGGTGGDGDEFEGGGFGSTGGDGGRLGGGGGSSGGNAGDGGDFGGGGGSAQILDGATGGIGGRGGFGGGAGGSSDGSPVGSFGGFGGGHATGSGVGGAGWSVGGAVFVREGGMLTYIIDLPSISELTADNSVIAAASGSGSPSVEGSDLFLMTAVAEIKTATGVNAELTGSIAGDGGILKSGVGTLILSGSNSYIGDTTVAAGVLQGDTDSLQGEITVQIDGTLSFSQSDDGTYSGDIDGAGGVKKQGGGTVRFSGTNTYQGATIIDEGVLSVTTSSLPGTTATTVNTDGTLRFNQSGSGSFSAPIGGTGILEKDGGGILTLDGDYESWAGQTLVSGGELALPFDTTLGGLIDVRSGGRLSGTGLATGDVEVSGTIAPGVAGIPGTLDVEGDLDLLSGSVLEIDLTDSGGDSDRVNVTGIATLDDNLTVEIVPSPGDYTGTLTYDILSASSIAGDPDLGIGASYCFFSSDLSIQGGNTLQLQLTGDLSGFSDRCAETSNQRAVGSALSAVLSDTVLPNIKDSLIILTSEQVPTALDLMSGEGLAGFQSTRIAAATQLMGTLSQRMRDPFTRDTGPAYPLAHSINGPLMPSLGEGARLDGGLARSVRTAAATGRAATPFSFVSMRGESGLGGFLDGFATLAGIEGDGNSNDTDFNLYGTTGGIDWAFADGALIGAAVGYTRSKLSVANLATWGTGDTFQGALYGGYATDSFYLAGVARYGYTQMKTRRRISFGEIFDTAKGDFDGTSISGYAEVGLASIELAETLFQPTAGFQYTYIQTDDFTETGAPQLNLGVLTPSVNSMVSNVGLRVYRAFTMDIEADIVPELRVRYAHEFGDTARPLAGRFADAATPAPFSVEAAEIGRDVAIVGAGWTVVGEGSSSLSLHYDVTLNEDILAHAISLGILIYW
ncbi:MAG: autotransporter domain-containing protein, partial [Myxococcota bacterium]